VTKDSTAANGDYANIGWNTWLRLRDYKRGALIEERASGLWHNPAIGSSGTRYRINITGAGPGAVRARVGPLPTC
jgi:hypothetical protein